MTRFLVLISIGLGLATIACQRQESATAERAVETSPGTGTGEKPDLPASTAAAYDLQFLDGLSRHHQMAVDMSKAGQEKFAHAELKRIAKKMIEEQESEIAQMKQWRDQWYPGAAPAEDMQMPGMASMNNMDMSHMQTMSGKQLDMMFIDMMIPHHQGAIEMARDGTAKAEHQEIKDLARKMIPAQEKEIEQFRKWKAQWNSRK